MKLVKRKRQTEERPTRAKAIRQYCYECSGHSMTEARLCTANGCWLYHLRPRPTRALKERAKDMLLEISEDGETVTHVKKER